MKQFFKENIYNMVRLLVNQLAMTIFGLVLAMACANSEPLLLLSSVLSVAFYLFLVYMMIYEIGQKDGIRISGGRYRYRALKGFWIALFANIPNLVLGILAIVSKASINGLGFFDLVSNLTNEEVAALSPSWVYELYSVTDTLANVIQCMYRGICKVLFPGNNLTLLFIPLPAIATCAIAYPLGVRYSEGFVRHSKNRSDRYK